MRRIHNIGIEDFLEAKIYEPQNEPKSLFFKGKTVSSWGKTELAKLVGDLGTKAIDRMRVRMTDASWQTITVTNTRGNNTLSVQGATLSTPGTYDLVECAYSGDTGSGSYHNSIDTLVALPSEGKLVFIVRWVFSGVYTQGNYTCASRLGNIGDDNDYPIGTLRIDDSGAVTLSTASTNSVNGNTLTCTHSTPFTHSPYTFDMFVSRTTNATLSDADPAMIFHQFTGTSIPLATGQELYTEHQYVFG